MGDLSERMRRALTRAEDGAGTLPAKESVKLRPADWHRLQDIIREAIPVLAALPKGEPVAWRWRLKYQDRDEWTDWQVTASRRDYGGPDVRIEESPLFAAPPAGDER